LFSLTRPSEEQIRSFLSSQEGAPFSYKEVGSSATSIPLGHSVDRSSTELGSGAAIWLRAVEAVSQWKMFNMPFLQVYPREAPIRVGTQVAVMVSHFGFYSLNACRIVYVIEEGELVKKFGFAYGTLAEHAESGEERFTELRSVDVGCIVEELVNGVIGRV
jgi:uncharacterized protein (UPF0548 family)